MPKRDLLPGVADDLCPPAVVFDSRRAIRRARLRAAGRDAAQLALIAALDYAFMTHPAAHLPMTGRSATAIVLAVFNSAVVAQILASRAFPRWTAKRIATTWCLAERTRFFAAWRSEQASK
jgi:hypothetical protein